MDDLRPDALATVAARVVAWHNRHPLARRITAEQVQSIGYVALPYLAPTPDTDAAGDKAPMPTPAATPAPVADAQRVGGPEGDVEQGMSLRERALARAQAAPASGPAAPAPPPLAPAAAKPAARKATRPVALKAAFTEDFIAPLARRRVAGWTARHGTTADRPPRDGPVRAVATDPTLAGPRAELITLYALTAMVELRGKRVRMLLAAGKSDAVIGNRLWSTPRMASAASVLGGVAAAAAAGLWLMPALQPAAPAGPAGGTTASPAAAVTAVAPMASIRPAALQASAAAELATQRVVLAASGPQALASGSAPHAPEAAAHGAMPARAASAASAATASQTPSSTPPVDVEPTLGRIVMPSLGLPGRRAEEALASARERRLAAAAEAAAATPARQAAPPPHAKPPDKPLPAQAAVAGAATAPAAPLTTSPAVVSAPLPSRAASAPPGHAAFAVSTRLLRTRAEAEQTLSAMQALLAAAGHATVHVELVAAGEDWRVVGWPFAQRAQADSARGLLATRGMRVNVIDF